MTTLYLPIRTPSSDRQSLFALPKCSGPIGRATRRNFRSSRRAGFGELAGVLFAPSGLIRSAKLFYQSGREEVVLVPLLYGLTWAIGKEYERAGRMTRFVAHLDSKDISPSWASGIGVGQQDLSIHDEDGKGNLFGLGTVSEITFAPDTAYR